MKRMLKVTSVFVLVLGIGLATAVAAFAQNSPITAVTDRTTLTTDETLVLTVDVQGADAEPQLPYLDGFDVVATGSSTNLSIVNGAISRSNSYQYRLQPTSTGDLTIPAISIVVDGVTYSTVPIAVQVTLGNGAAQPGGGLAQPAPAPSGDIEPPAELNGQDLYVEAAVDNPAPYQGETFTYIFRFYQAVNLYREPNYAPPSFSGFWSDGEPQQVDYTVEAANRTYRVSEVQTTLVPTAAGQVTIDATTLTIPGSLFESSRTLQTYPVTIDVQPWPQGAPADFKGAVGKFALSAKVDAAEAKVNEPVTLQVVLSGEGNLNTAGDPIWTEGPEWRVFEPTAVLDVQKQNGKFSGQKVYERLLIPTEAGELTIPPISYSYFDPETAVYHTLTTDPIVVTVAEGAASTAVIGSSAAATPIQPETNADIRAIKPAPEKTAVAPLTQSPAYWLLWLLPLGLVAGQWAYKRRQTYWQANGDKTRRQQAAKKAAQALQSAQKNNQNPHTAVAHIFHEYLADKLNRAVHGLTRRELRQLLAEQSVGEGVLTDVEALLERCEYGRYTPAHDTDATLWSDAQAVIEKLEQAL